MRDDDEGADHKGYACRKSHDDDNDDDE